MKKDLIKLAMGFARQTADIGIWLGESLVDSVKNRFIEPEHHYEIQEAPPFIKRLKMKNIVGMGVTGLVAITTCLVINSQEAPQKRTTNYEKTHSAENEKIKKLFQEKNIEDLAKSRDKSNLDGTSLTNFYLAIQNPGIKEKNVKKKVVSKDNYQNGIIRDDDLKNNGAIKELNGEYALRGFDSDNNNGKIMYLGFSSVGNVISGLTVLENGKNIGINFIADKYGRIEVSPQFVDEMKYSGRTLRWFKGIKGKNGKIKYISSIPANLHNYQPKIEGEKSLLEGQLEKKVIEQNSFENYQIADNTYWVDGNLIEKSVSKNLNSNPKHKFDTNEFTNTLKYDSFKDDYLNGKESLKTVAAKYGMSASTAGRLGKEIYGGLGRKSSRMINGVYD